MSAFEEVKQAPPDPIFGVAAAFRADTRSTKVNLGPGVYRTADLQVPLLGSVQKAEIDLAQQGRSRSYLPIGGDPEYIAQLTKLAFGDAVPDGLWGAQTPGGTGALRVVGEFLKRVLGKSSIYLSSPTWANHRAIFAACDLKIELYDYYDRQKRTLKTEKMLEALRAVPTGTPVLFHASCHNPTGVDPSTEEWREIHSVVVERSLLPIFDCAYQGLGDGLESDVAAIRFFASQKTPFVLCYSCSKNFSVYAERTGALFFHTGSADESERVGSQARAVIRTIYSNPPAHGAAAVRTVLGSEELHSQWLQELSAMRVRIQEMRKSLMSGLTAKARDCDFSFIGQQKGLFSFIGLEKEQVDRLAAEFAIYMPSNGRVNVTGLGSENLDYVVEAIVSVL